MGGRIEINDTLQITTEQGFPADILDVKGHQQRPILLEDIAGRVCQKLPIKDRQHDGALMQHPVVFDTQNPQKSFDFWGTKNVLCTFFSVPRPSVFGQQNSTNATHQR